MNIDRSNYELWFIDWLDGNLDSLQTKELYGFLDVNPDLKEEFSDLSNIPLLSPEKQYPFKNTLKKSFEEISESQFEYLSAAYLEKDLSEIQKSEIEEIIAKDPEKKRIFEQINKTHLLPLNLTYKHKRQLLKPTPAQRIIRLTVIGLSIAAAITLIITTYLSVPHNLQDNKTNEAVLIIPGNNLKQKPADKINDKIDSPDNKHSETVKTKVKKAEVFSPDQTFASLADLADKIKEDSAVSSSNEPGVGKIKIAEFSGLSQSTGRYELASSFIYIPDEEADNGRSKIGKYIAKTFREKFLKEKTPPDSPLKAYEIAEAGVTGINKIFGWEMALDKKNDQNGNLKSVYFSSRILKFNAPVKKSEPLP
jgi:hypothetical protein